VGPVSTQAARRVRRSVHCGVLHYMKFYSTLLRIWHCTGHCIFSDLLLRCAQIWESGFISFISSIGKNITRPISSPKPHLWHLNMISRCCNEGGDSLYHTNCTCKPKFMHACLPYYLFLAISFSDLDVNHKSITFVRNLSCLYCTQYHTTCFGYTAILRCITYIKMLKLLL
jgi:hypothetical protein